MEDKNGDLLRPLYIECGTTMVHSSFNTGIQRVVRNIVKESTLVGSKFGFKCIPLELYQGDFYTIDLDAKLTTAQDSKPLSFKSLIKFFIKSLLVILDREISKLCNYSYYQQLRKKLKQKIKQRGKNQNKTVIKLNPYGDRETPSVLLLLDSTWDNAIWPQVDEFRKNGGIVCAVVYDLIPFTHPDTVAELTRTLHTSWWNQAPHHIDTIMCISKSMRQCYLDWQVQRNLPNPLPGRKIGYFYLGSDMASTDPLINLLTDNEPYFLMVGSLEPRKNHNTVLTAFEQLWASGLKARLAIVGAFGWKSNDLIERVQNHPQLNHQLFLIRDASDRDLTGLYNKTNGLIIASVTEGFGLPIVEAYHHDAPVICSDIPVFREVGGEEVCYFEVLNPTSLATQIIAKMESGERAYVKPKTKVQRWITWQESTERLLNQVSRMEK